MGVVVEGPQNRKILGWVVFEHNTTLNKICLIKDSNCLVSSKWLFLEQKLKMSAKAAPKK